MNVNGSRFHLLLGRADWGRCRVELDDGPRALADWWTEPSAATPDSESTPELAPQPGPHAVAPTTLEPAPFAWDDLRDELRLQRLPVALPATPGEVPFSLDARRAAAADCNGNLYWIDADRRRLRVRSIGSGREAAFWPDGPRDCTGDRRDFGPGFGPITGAAEPSPDYQALAVTEDHYLVVAYRTPTLGGLLAFDLVAGGPPHALRWPEGLAIEPFALAPRLGGGLWLLDRDAARLWELDRRLALVVRPEPVVAEQPMLFQPLDGPTRARARAPLPAGIDLRSPDLGVPPGISPLTESPLEPPFEPPADPIAIAARNATTLLILDRNGPAGPSRVYRLRLRDHAWQADPPVGLGELAHDLVLAEPLSHDGTAALRLLVTTATGNQALAFAVGADDAPFRLRGAVELYPLRRYGGRALVQVQGKAWYDSGQSNLRWVPVVEQSRLSHRDESELITPVLDGQEPQCVWDRLLLDACIGADTRVEVWCRAADECLAPDTDAAEPIAPWLPQPGPRLRRDGAELPWLRAAARQPTNRPAGSGTWELTLQGQRGRWLQLRLRLTGNGSASPRLRALRVWYPRFSYPRRFLPAVYREDPLQGDFLERFLANLEQVNTQIEDRIAQAQALLDPWAAPAEALDWLAGWFDLALDPAWDERRRRLLIANALTFFRWRGTAHGLRIALALAFEPCIDVALFAEPDADTAATPRPRTGIRIVETYQTRLLGNLATGDPDRTGGTTLPRAVAAGAYWTPQEGNAGLAQRYARATRNADADATEQLRPFPLFAPILPSATPVDQAEVKTAVQTELQARWSAFCTGNLGFVPAVGAGERRRWQCFLADRYPSVTALGEVHVSPAQTPPGQAPLGLQQAVAGLDLPRDWPEQADVGLDWRAYCALPEPTRQRWQAFLARRWRRIERLNDDWQTRWPGFGLIPLPDHLPTTTAAQTDWLQFEAQILAMHRTAHRFSVLLPVADVNQDPAEMQRRLGLAQRITALEKPAHTIFDVRFYWSLNRLGAARLGLDTLLGAGSRAKALIPDAVLGRAYLGAGFVGAPERPADPARRPLAC